MQTIVGRVKVYQDELPKVNQLLLFAVVPTSEVFYETELSHNLQPTRSSRMTERRKDHLTRKRVAEMSPEEMRRALLVSDKTDLPNRRSFDEGKVISWVAMCDVNGLKALNDKFGYSAGDILIKRFAEVLVSVRLDAYHDKGDEFLCTGTTLRSLTINSRRPNAF